MQWWDGHGALLRYCVGYVSKYNEAWDLFALEEAGTAATRALHLLRGWRAAEAEMAMVLAREPMVFTNVIGKEYRPPLYGQGEDTALHLYRRRPHAREHMTFLEWLRAHTVTGSLDDNSAQAKVKTAQRITCVGILSKRLGQDQYWWQWLLLQKAHRLLTELVCPEALEAPSRLRCFALALHALPGTWDNNDWVKGHLEEQGHKAEFVVTWMARVQATRSMLRRHRAGAGLRQVAPPLVTSHLPLSQAQSAFLALLQEDARRREAALQLAEEGEHGDAAEALFMEFGPVRARCLLGGPGAGKTHCVTVDMEHWCAAGKKVLYATPTGKLATAMPGRENLLCTTYHRAFGLLGDDPRAWGNEALAHFDVWIVDEVSMLPKAHFEAMLAQWRHAGSWPHFIFVGDFAQLPPVGHDTADARSSAAWRHMDVHDLGCATSFRTRDAELLAFQALIRTRPPAATELEPFLQKAQLSEEVTDAALQQLWSEMPHAPVLCATQATAAHVNACAAKLFATAYFPEVLVWAADAAAAPQGVRFFESARVRLTQTLSLDHGWVNGASGTVVGMDAAGVHVAWDHGDVSVVWPITRKRQTVLGRTYLQGALPLTLAYALTLHQVQGQSLAQAAVIFEDFCPPGWAYTALTRVKALNGLRILGAATCHHFRPKVRVMCFCFFSAACVWPKSLGVQASLQRRLVASFACASPVLMRQVPRSCYIAFGVLGTFTTRLWATRQAWAPR